MFQIDNSTAVAARPAPAAAGAPGWATSGNPAAGQLPTSLDADYVNGLQGELLSILQAADIAPDKTQIDQVLESIQLLTLKWLGGGVYRGVNYIANSRTLDASYCGYLNILINVPVETLPLANSVPSGTPIDFACQAGGAVIARQGDDQISLLESGATQYVCGTSSKVRFVSDGVGAWVVAQESNLYAPNFRGPATAVTAAPTDNSGLLSTTAFAKGVGLRANAYFEFNQANVGIAASWLGGLIWNDYYNAAFSLPPVAQCEPNTAVTIYAYQPLQLSCSGSESLLGVGASVAMTAGSVFQAIPQPAAGGWRLILDPRVIGGRQQVVSTSAITGVVPSKNFTWQVDQYESVRFEWTGLRSNARGQYQGPNGAEEEQFDVSIYVAAGGVKYNLSSGSDDFTFSGQQQSDGFLEVFPLQSGKPAVTSSSTLFGGGRTNGFLAPGGGTTVKAFQGDGVPQITEIGLIGVAQNTLAGSDTSGVGLSAGAFIVRAR